MKTFYLMTMGFCLALNLHAQRSEYLLEKGWKFTKGTGCKGRVGGRASQK